MTGSRMARRGCSPGGGGWGMGGGVGGVSCLLAAMRLVLAGGCRGDATGPVPVSAIGAAPHAANPNREPLDAPSAFLLQSVAQGLVRFDATADIEPGLAQSWIVSNDGLRYTFRLKRAKWPDGSPITADQVVARLKAAGAPGSL